VRRAVYQAINIDLMIQKVLKGLATPTGDLLAPEFGTPPGLNGPRPRFDPVRRARAAARGRLPRRLRPDDGLRQRRASASTSARRWRRC
jgi:peptide/nickel transport system substrate-binding protein